MKRTTKFTLVLITAPDVKTARKLATTILRHRLAACVNLVPSIESHYWWQGKLERGQEVLLIVKTIRPRLTALEKAILKNHPYDTPEIIAVPLTAGTSRYLAWIEQSITARS